MNSNPDAEGIGALQICRSYGAREFFAAAFYKYSAPNGAHELCNDVAVAMDLQGYSYAPRAPLGAAYL